MKTLKFFCAVLFALAVFASPAFAASHGTGQVVIKRSANFGQNLYADVYVDGQRVDRLQLGHDYVGALAAGRHEIRIDVPRRRHDTSGAVKHVTVHAGQTYKFTASWQGQDLVLR
jgi:hypothetical protein